MKRYLIVVVSAILVFVTCIPSFADVPRVVRVGAFNYYPGIFKDTDGSVKGFYVDALADIAQRENIHFEYVYGSWSDGLERIKTGDVDVLTSVAFTQERAQFLDYAKTPLLTVWGELYVPFSSEIDVIRAVGGKKIAVMKGDFNARHFIELVKKFDISCEFVEMPGFDDVFKAVAAKKVDAGVVNSTFGVARQTEFGLRSTGIVFNPFDIFFVVAKGKNNDLLELLDTYLNSWKHQEASPFNKARQKWSHGSNGSVAVIPRWLVAVAAILTIISLCAFVFVVLLRRQVGKKTAELKSANRELAEQGERLASIINGTTDAVFIKDTAGRYLVVNDEVVRLFNVPKPEIIGYDDRHFFPPDEADALISGDKVIMDGGSVVTHEEIVTTLGSKRVYLATKGPVYDGNGTLAGIFGVSRDITEIRQTKDQLAQGKEQLELVLEGSLLGFWDWNIETGEVTRNERWAEMLGYTLSEIDFSTNRWSDLVHHDDRERAWKSVNDHLEGRTLLHEIEYRLLARDGRYVWVLDRAKVVKRDAEGRPLRMSGTHTDISQRKLAEELLRDSKEKYRQLLNNLASGVVVHAPDTSIIFANPMALSLLGLSKDQIKGKAAMDPAWCFVRENGTVMPLEEYPVNRVLSAGKPLSDYSVGIRHPDVFDTVWVLCHAYPVSNAEGQLQQIVVTFIDISKRKRAEDALNKRLVALTRPIEHAGITFDELFNIEELQRLQDEFAKATGVASIITDPSGRPVTEPSNFTRLCRDIIRNTEKGCANCFKSDAALGRYNPDGPVVQPCLSGGLWDAGAGIAIDGHHIANWLIGQVRDNTQNEEAMRAYAREIGADETGFMAAFYDVPSMSREHFEQIAHALFTFANQLSTTAYQNIQQARFIAERKKAEDKIRLNETRLKSLVSILQYPAESVQHFLDNALNEAIKLTESTIGYIYFYNEERQEFELNSWSNEVMKECSVVNPQAVYHLDKTGFWGEAVRQRQPIILNDFETENPLRKGYPEGHVHLRRFMTLPLFADNRIVAVVGVANRGEDYDDENVLQLTLLMDSVWKYVENRKNTIALLQEQARAQSYLDTVETMIVALDVEGNITTINRKACQILGYDEDELLGKSWFVTCLPQAEGSDQVYPYFKKLMAGKVEVNEYHENEVITAGGKLRRIAWHNSLLRNDTGQISGTLSSGEDITDRIQAEEKNSRLESQLQQAQKMESVGRLAGGVAHDFNNMLSVILGHSELALMRVGLDHPVSADLKEINKAAERSAELTRQLLTFARKQAVMPKVIELNETVSSMLRMLQRLIGEDINLIWQPAHEPCQIKIDPSQIDQILANLCVNARDAIANTGRITIETGICSVDAGYCAANPDATPGEYVRLVVSDTGSGMDRETINHIFEPFFTTKKLGEGTGLGLATVYGAIKQNNGFITIYSEPGQGTTFSIHLPRYEGQNLMKPETNASLTIPEGLETILLVEDEPAILNIAAMMLGKQGYTVLKADTPGKAIELAREHTGIIHLLMSDVIMPEMNGRDLSMNIRAFCPQMKTIFMSGYTADVIAHHGVLDSGVHFIQKPFSLPVLAGTVREVLDQ